MKVYVMKTSGMLSILRLFTWQAKADKLVDERASERLSWSLPTNTTTCELLLKCRERSMFAWCLSFLY